MEEVVSREKVEPLSLETVFFFIYYFIFSHNLLD
jgi:hypothetical protein